MAASDKDTIYVDVDDEITTIIDKVRGSDGKIVVLVLPKRATVFQSIVNMKLLKRTAESAKKHIVLVTGEASLMPLAGAVGLHVAATPQSKPEIPEAQLPATMDDSDDEPITDDGYTADNAGDRPVGELAGRSGHLVPGTDTEDAVTLPDDGGDSDDTAKPAKAKKNRHLMVPNFNAFRLRLILTAVVLAAAIAGIVAAAIILPKAAIAITTNTSTVNVNLTATLDSAATALDTTKSVVPAKSEQQQKTTSQQVNTTGQKNTGTAATGSVTMSAVACAPNLGQPNAVPSGTGVTVNGLTFITQETTHFNSFGTGHGSCVTYGSTSTTDITAQTGGTKYNLSSATFSVAGRSDVSATGSTSGGTDNIINIVAQADIDSATQKLAAADTDAIKSALEQALRLDSMYPLPATFNAGTPVVTTSANVGDTADTVTVTQAVTYTMFGAKQADLDALIQKGIGTEIDPKTQSILNDGLADAQLNVTNNGGTSEQVTIQTTATVGPNINAADIKRQSVGKKIGDVKAMISPIPGVTNVDVKLSPFWVSTVPSDLTKITVTINKSK